MSVKCIVSNLSASDLQEWRREFGSLRQDSFGCTRIVETHLRAISLEQLNTLWKYIENRADQQGALQGWEDQAPMSPTYGQKLHTDTINLYQVCHWIVKPATAPFQCSFVELLHVQACDGCAEQRPDWFVSHCWSEEVQEFVAAVREHARIRSLQCSNKWWVCAYANNQHDLGKDLTADPRRTSFFKAMEISQGVLLILDQAATPFRRIWCCFEEAMTVLMPFHNRQPLLLDIATSHAGVAQILTDGLVADECEEDDTEEGDQEDVNPESFKSWRIEAHCGTGHGGWERKLLREIRFPLQVLEKGFDVDIYNAEASVPVDRNRILNCISRREKTELDHLPLESSHANFSKVNGTLRRTFAVAAWRKSAEEGRLAKAAQALAADQWVQNVRLSLRGSASESALKITWEAISQLASLEVLHIDCGSSSALVGVPSLGEGVVSLKQLKALHLSFSRCSSLCDVHPLFSSFSQMPMLSELEIDCTLTDIVDVPPLGRCRASSGFTAHSKCSTIYDLHELKSLQLNVRRTKVHDISAFIASLRHAPSLQTLDLKCSLTNLKRLPPFTNSVGTLSCVTTLKLSFRRCLELIDMTLFMESFQFLCSLQSLTLDCKMLPEMQLSGIASYSHPLIALRELSITMCNCRMLKASAFMASLQHAPELLSLQIHFDGCGLPSVLQGLPESLMHMTKLRDLDLDCSRCPLASLPALTCCLHPLVALVSLRLRCCASQVLQDASLLFESFNHMPLMRNIELDLGGPNKLTSLPGLAVEGQTLECLERLHLALRFSKLLHNLDAFLDSLERQPSLGNLYLDLRDCLALPKHNQKKYEQVNDIYTIARRAQ